VSLIDARSDEVGAELETALCVIGAGAAGITVARALGAAGIDTLLIESGDLALDPATQALYEGEQTGISYYDLTSCRLRFYGGTTNHWGGYCRANDPINYEGRPELGVPAWPVTEAEARPFLEHAAAELGVDARFHEPFAFLADAGVEADDALDRAQGDLFTAVNQISRRKRLGPLHLDELRASERVRFVTNLNAVELVLSPDGRRIERLACRTLTGKDVAVRARAYVLACHAIENARLLLASNSVAPAGVGNGRDLVGRFFMEHPQIDSGLMTPGPAFHPFYDRAALVPQGYLAAVSLTSEAMRREGTLSYHMHFIDTYVSPEAKRAARRFARGLTEPFRMSLLRDAGTVMGEMGGLAWMAAENAGVPVPERMKVMRLNHTWEQSPNPDSRVTLGSERDALGVPQVVLHWALSEQDLHTLQAGQRVCTAELSALGFGRFALEDLGADAVRANVRGHYHHYGTTRMAADPSKGVVDADGRVHGVENLYVGGSSTFPTAAAHGPTLHIIAFSLRLANALTERVGAMEPPR
jgi:choline dehydrogenase-like flavoprotein